MLEIQNAIKGLPGTTPTNQTKFSDVIIPYWDWTRDRTVDAFPFSADFMGKTGDPTDNYDVKTGPFVKEVNNNANWVIKYNDSMYSYPERGTPGYDDDNANRSLRRHLGGTLPTPENLATSLANTTYRTFEDALEINLHNSVHNWACDDGGDMDSTVSPNDPIFSLNHMMVDRIWAQWQSGRNKFTEYDAGDPTSFSGMNMSGFKDVKPEDVLDFTQLGYTYDILATPTVEATFEKDFFPMNAGVGDTGRADRFNFVNKTGKKIKEVTLSLMVDGTGLNSANDDGVGLFFDATSPSDGQHPGGGVNKPGFAGGAVYGNTGAEVTTGLTGMQFAFATGTPSLVDGDGAVGIKLTFNDWSGCPCGPELFDFGIDVDAFVDARLGPLQAGNIIAGGAAILEDDTVVSFVVNVVPEPSMFWLLAYCGLTVFAVRSRNHLNRAA